MSWRSVWWREVVAIVEAALRGLWVVKIGCYSSICLRDALGELNIKLMSRGWRKRVELLQWKMFG